VVADALGANVGAFLALLAFGLSLLLLVVSAISWARLRGVRLAAIALAFAALAIETGLLSWQVVTTGEPQILNAALDLAVLGLFYASVAAR
jgi:hypothetical protein